MLFVICTYIKWLLLSFRSIRHTIKSCLLVFFLLLIFISCLFISLYLFLFPLRLFLSSLFISSSLHLFPLNISSSSQAYLGSAVDSKFDVKTDLPGFVGCLRGLQLDSNPVSLSSLLAQNPGESELCFVFLYGLQLPNARMSQ